MRSHFKFLFLIACLAVCVQLAKGQSLPADMATKVDSIFSRWNNSMGPGCSIGIVRNDSLIYAKGYGLANLEYTIPNTPATIFHMASVSKQFTAWAIIMLARQGKLRLDDDVRKWLPWFPDLKQRITIQHLLNHTSGIRDQWQLLAISGTRLDDVITQEHIVKILSKQQALNFNPGEKYSYSNSGYTMLAEIVKSVSGQTLRKFTDSAIFKPLGMVNTHFHDNYTEIEKNRAYSYEPLDSGRFANAILSYSNAGATSLFTNVKDMSKWVTNFYTHTVGDQLDVDSLVRKGKLNNGAPISYANGISVGTYKGWKEYSHSGGDAGYRTYLTVLPDLKMGFMVFSNAGDFNPNGTAEKMMELFVKDTSKKESVVPVVKKDSLVAILKDGSRMKRYVGDYIGDEGLPCSITIKEGKLYYHIFNESNVLVNTSKDSFAIIDAPFIKFAFSAKAKDTVIDIITPDELYHLTRYIKDTTRSDRLLAAYTGNYYCPELDCRYEIILKDHRLLLTNNKYTDAKIEVINNDHLRTDNWWISHLKMIRDNKNAVTGFEVNAGRIMHLKFVKL
jgi:CubicO group peptidase (beta-lactamase class C family)